MLATGMCSFYVSLSKQLESMDLSCVIVSDLFRKMIALSTFYTFFGIYKDIYFFSVVKTCIADEIDHATRDKVPSTYDYDTSVVYSCNTGYSKTAGDLSRKCIDTNTWSGTAPTCSGKLVCMKDADNFQKFYFNNLPHE